MAMTREEQDAFDRRMAGIMSPNDPMADTQRGMAGGPIASYSLSDIRSMLGLAPRPAMSPAEVADAAQMYERLPNPRLPPTPPGGYDAPSPSIPYMPSTDPRGAAAPIPPPPRPAAAPRPRLPVAPGAVPAMVEPIPPAPVRPDTVGGVSPADMAAMGQVAPPINPPRIPIPADSIGVPRPMIAPGTMVPGTLPGEASNVAPRLNAEQLARALRRYGRMEMDPESFAARYARTQR